MKACFKLIAVIWCITGVFAHADTEADRAATIVRERFNDPAKKEFRKAFEKLATETTPRFFELMRRIDAPLEALGDLKGDGERNTTAKFLYSQIDALLLDQSITVSEEIVAARIIYFFGGSAVRLIYWNSSGEGKNMKKTVWTRIFPANMIDLTEPLDSWNKTTGSYQVSINECQALLPFFKDPMPPTALPSSVAYQLASFEAGIIEMITRSDDGLNYHWAIRSSPYTRDLDFEAFKKVWTKIRDAPETKSEQVVPSDGHKPTSRAPSDGPTAPADAH